MTAALLESVVAPLDRARSIALRVMVRSSALRRIVAKRDTRLAFTAVVHASVAAVLAVVCPSLLFVVGPVALGVLHVAADVRYLVLRRKLPALFRPALWSFCLALIALRIFGEVYRFSRGLDRVEFALAGLFVLTAVGFGARGGTVRSRVMLAVLVVLGLTVLAVRFPVPGRLVLSHGHNVVALVLWMGVFRAQKRLLLVPLVFISVVAVLLGSGALYEAPLHGGLSSAFGLHVLAISDYLAPGLRADYAIGLVQLFVFMQSVHYAVWLLLVPEEDERATGATSFRRSVRAMAADFGVPGLVLVAAVAVVVVGFSLTDAIGTSRVYLSLALFHGYLELAMLAYFFCRGFPSSVARGGRPDLSPVLPSSAA